MPFLPAIAGAVDWVITNPPFRLAEQFVHRGLAVAPNVAVIVRTAFAESIQRYEELFRDLPPSLVGQFVERVPMVKGRVDEEASSATAYCWMVWDHRAPGTRLTWIPPCRDQLERAGDYAPPEIEPSLPLFNSPPSPLVSTAIGPHSPLTAEPQGAVTAGCNDYDAQADLAGSIREGLAAIRARESSEPEHARNYNFAKRELEPGEPVTQQENSHDRV